MIEQSVMKLRFSRSSRYYEKKASELLAKDSTHSCGQRRPSEMILERPMLLIPHRTKWKKKLRVRHFNSASGQFADACTSPMEVLCRRASRVAVLYVRTPDHVVGLVFI